MASSSSASTSALLAAGGLSAVAACAGLLFSKSSSPKVSTAALFWVQLARSTVSSIPHILPALVRQSRRDALFRSLTTLIVRLCALQLAPDVEFLLQRARTIGAGSAGGPVDVTSLLAAMDEVGVSAGGGAASKAEAVNDGERWEGRGRAGFRSG